MTKRPAIPLPKRGYSRTEAANYIGISASKFDEMVRDGRIHPPIRIDGRVLWLIEDLDAAIDALKDAQQATDSWSDFRNGKG